MKYTAYHYTYFFFFVTLRWIKQGIWFLYKGDEVLYVWPWRRKEDEGISLTGGHKYLSLFSEGYFGSLREMDEFWDGYAKAERTCWERDNGGEVNVKVPKID